MFILVYGIQVCLPGLNKSRVRVAEDTSPVNVTASLWGVGVGVVGAQIRGGSVGRSHAHSAAAVCGGCSNGCAL